MLFNRPLDLQLKEMEEGTAKYRELLEESLCTIQQLSADLEEAQAKAGEAKRWMDIAGEHKVASESFKAALELSHRRESELAKQREDDKDALEELAQARTQVMTLEDQARDQSNVNVQLMRRVTAVEEEALALREEKVRTSLLTGDSLRAALGRGTLLGPPARSREALEAVPCVSGGRFACRFSVTETRRAGSHEHTPHGPPRPPAALCSIVELASADR